VWFGTIVQGTETIVLRLYERGRVQIYNPWRGSSIRVFTRPNEEIGNRSEELAACHPMLADQQRDRIWSQQLNAASTELAHHARVGGAVQGFLKTG